MCSWVAVKLVSKPPAYFIYTTLHYHIRTDRVLVCPVTYFYGVCVCVCVYVGAGSGRSQERGNHKLKVTVTT